jgi:hypothetical protein
MREAKQSHGMQGEYGSGLCIKDYKDELVVQSVGQSWLHVVPTPASGVGCRGNRLSGRGVTLRRLQPAVDGQNLFLTGFDVLLTLHDALP